MNPANCCKLEGVVHGECWTRYRAVVGAQRGQVRFWLAVSRDLAGSGLDYLLCALELGSIEDLRRYEVEIRDGRHVQLEAQARALDEQPQERNPAVLFVAESCTFCVGAIAAGQRPHRVAAHGKLAAAHDDSDAELPLEAVS